MPDSPPLSRPDPTPPALGRERTPPDRGTPASRLFALLAAILLAGAAIVWQNLPETAQHAALGLKPPAPPPAERVVDPFSPPAIHAKLYLKVPMMGAAPKAMVTLDKTVITDADRIVAAVAAAELQGPDAALDRLDDVRASLDQPAAEPPSPDPERDALRTDLDTFELAYTAGPSTLSDYERARLVARYGYFARVALTHGLDDADPARAPLLAGGTTILVVLLLVGLLFAGALLAGLAVLVVAIVLLASGRLRFSMPVPRPGGSVYLETYALFVAGFLVMAVGTTALAARSPAASHPLADLAPLLLQWALLLTPLWALARGTRRASFAHALGLHAGRGFFREIALGVLAYLAAVPLFAAGVLVTIVLLVAREMLFGPPDALPTNPVLELLASADLLTILLVLTLACVWAPLCEELIFRGALYRHLRARLHWALASLLTALLFAYMHSYGPLMVAPLIALGFMFALIREWRGSILPCITAHALHNGALMTTMIVVLSVLAD